MPEPQGEELARVRARREDLRKRYLHPLADRGPSTVSGVHHLALICQDAEETIKFYQEFLGFPLVELVENRDYAGSNHFFFDIGNHNLLGFFDFPGTSIRPGRRPSAAFSIWPSRSRPTSSRRPGRSWTRPRSTTWARTAARTTACTSATPTEWGWSCTARTWGCSKGNCWSSNPGQAPARGPASQG